MSLSLGVTCLAQEKAVPMSINAGNAWTHFGAHSYILPRPGKYRFGLLSLTGGGNLVQQYEVVTDRVAAQSAYDCPLMCRGTTTPAQNVSRDQPIGKSLHA
jgi:hypothetical protein